MKAIWIDTNKTIIATGRTKANSTMVCARRPGPPPEQRLKRRALVSTAVIGLRVGKSGIHAAGERTNAVAHDCVCSIGGDCDRCQYQGVFCHGLPTQMAHRDFTISEENFGYKVQSVSTSLMVVREI